MRIFLVFIGLLISVFCVKAQGAGEIKYHGAALYGCKGKVKEIFYSTEDPILLEKVIKFLPNGQSEHSIMTYDQNGFPIGFNINAGNRISVNIDYQNDKLKEVEIQTNLRGDEHRTIDMIYEGDLLKQRINKDVLKDKISTISTYSDYQYDDQGNWISRTVELESPEEGEIEKFTETRVITYY